MWQAGRLAYHAQQAAWRAAVSVAAFRHVAALEETAAFLGRRAEGESKEDGEGCYGLFHCFSVLLFSCLVGLL